MTLSIATWNINSVRLRIDLVTNFLEAHRPDVLCLQEIKCIEDNFPSAAFRKLGYIHQAVHGQKGYHGVATVSRKPFIETKRRGFYGKEDARHIQVALTDRDLPHLFDRFYRGATAANRAAGTGMGLWIARGLLSAQGGRIWAENCPDGGARFTIVIPAATRPPAALAEATLS